MALDFAHRWVNRMAGAPLVRQLRKARLDRLFDDNPGMNLFRGVYPSYEAAAASIPPSRREGYDSTQAAKLYETWLDLFEYDYPPLFWLQRSFAEGLRTVCDLGGNIGFKFIAFRRAAWVPDEVRWTVVDVPAVLERGQSFAQEHGVAAQLSFADAPAAMDGKDVLFASGSLQYIPRTLPEMLHGLHAAPRRIVVNLMPVHPARTYYTVNSFGPGYSAYRVEQRDAFIRAVEARGYSLRGEWKNLNKPLELPFDAGLSLDHYTGFCFERR